MVGWAIRSKEARVLEPSCGDGSVLSSIATKLIELGANRDDISNDIIGVEIDYEEVLKARKALSKLDIPFVDRVVQCKDFFSYYNSNLFGKRVFDCVIGNPPFVRYQDFPPEMKEVSFKIMYEAGLRPIGHTNLWVPFLVSSSLLLADDGVLAMIVPEQLFQVSYAAETRLYLSRCFKKLTIVAFRKLAFDNALQGVAILLGEKDNARERGIRIVEYEDPQDLTKNKEKLKRIWNAEEFKLLDHTRDKWTQYFLKKDEIQLLRELKEKHDLKCGDLLDVDIGVVTGKNKYFILTNKELKSRNLYGHTSRIVTNSTALRGIVFCYSDWVRVARGDHPLWLFDPPKMDPKDWPHEVEEYVKHGEEIGVSKGYKCRIRKEWYQVPSTWIPDAFMLRQVYDYPKMVLNKARVTCTDTLHRVRFHNPEEARKTIAAFLNSMTFAFSEVLGRSYGGGVLILEPSEAERVPVSLEGAEQLDFQKIDKLEREKRIEDILTVTDEVVLFRGLGLSQKQVKMLRDIWLRLQNRRVNMSKKSQKKKTS